MTVRVANKKLLGQVPMCPQLRPLYENELGPWTILPNRTVTCGSADDNDIVLKARGIQPHHCRIDFTTSALRIRRLDGRIWVNDLPINSDVPLSIDDRISIGALSIIVDETPLTIPPVQRPKESSVTETEVSFVGDSSLRFESAFPAPPRRNQLQFFHYSKSAGMELERLQQELNTREIILRRNEERCAELLLELEQLRAQYSEATVAEASQKALLHKQELQESRQETAAEQQRNHQLAEELQQLQQQLDEQKLELETRGEELQQLRLKDNEQQRQDHSHQELLAENRMLRGQLMDLQAEVLQLRHELDLAAAQVNRYAASLEDQSVELHFIRHQLAETNVAVSARSLSTPQPDAELTTTSNTDRAATAKDESAEPPVDETMPGPGDSVGNEAFAGEPDRSADELDPPLPPAVNALLDQLNGVSAEHADDATKSSMSDVTVMDEPAEIDSIPPLESALAASEIIVPALAVQVAHEEPEPESASESESNNDEDFPAGKMTPNAVGESDVTAQESSSTDLPEPYNTADSRSTGDTPQVPMGKSEPESSDAVDIDSYVERLLAQQAQNSSSQVKNSVVVEPRREAEERKGRRSMISFIEEYMSGRIQFEGDEPVPLRSLPESKEDAGLESSPEVHEGYRPRSVVSVREPIDFGKMRLENEGFRNLSAHCAEQALMSYFLRREQSGLVIRTAIVAGFLLLIAFGRPTISQLTGVQEFSRWGPVFGLLFSCAELGRKLMRVIRIRRGMTHVTLRKRGALPAVITPAK